MTGETVLVFDSGIGGLTVLREARVLMPEKRFVYVADDAGFPYGRWEEAALTQRIVELFDRLRVECRPAVSIIACNTASTLVLRPLREAYPDMAFVGTVPAIKPAAERTRSGLVSVLATPGTVRRAYTRDLIQSFASQCHVRLVGSENLAGLSEAYIRGEPVHGDDLTAEIAPCFVDQAGRRTDIVVLACTHYPFLANRFRGLAPWPVDWIDPAEAIARRAHSLLEPHGPISDHPDVAFFTSGAPDFATRRLMSGFGLTFVSGWSVDIADGLSYIRAVRGAEALRRDVSREPPPRNWAKVLSVGGKSRQRRARFLDPVRLTGRYCFVKGKCDEQARSFQV